LKEKHILDVGCCPGTDLVYYKKKGAIVAGIDISNKEIVIAKKKVEGDLRVGRMEKLPFRKNSFDIVTSVYALQSSKNVTEALLEMVRVAKKDATIVVLTKHPFRNILEGYKNNRKLDYFKSSIITSYIFKRKIKLEEPSHTLMEYLAPELLRVATLEFIGEYEDFPASEQVIENLIFPTYMIIKLQKK